MLLSDAQLHEIRQIIADYHNAFIANVISPDAVESAVLEKLKEKGLIRTEVNSLEDAYLYGQVLAAMNDPKLANMSYDQFREYLRANPVQLNPIERRAVQIAQHQAAQDTVGLGNRISTDFGQTILTTDTQLANEMRDTIRTVTAEAIARRETAAELKTTLGETTQDWARDWDRIAITEMHNAREHGYADNVGKHYGGEARVCKITQENACQHCKELHIGPDGYPRIFKLSQLEAHGTNVGRKAKNWEAVVGPIHPHCSCVLQRVPNGWGFNEEGNLAPGGEFGIEYDSREDLEEALKGENDLMKSVKEGHVDYLGLPITIENAPGTKRHWQDENGKTGSTTMLFAYGYLDDTDAMDGDELDVYIGPDPKAETVYIVHQQNPHTGIYDEEKCFLGFNDERTAKQAYRYHFDTPEDYLLTVTPMALDGFKRWAHSSTKQKDNPDVRLVIPLDMKKAELGSTGRESTEFVETMADARAPGPGVGANYVFPVPQRGPMVTVGINELAPREMLEQAIPRGNAVKRDRHVYDFTEPLHQEPHKIEIPEQFLDLTMLDPKEEERRKQLIIKLGKRNIRHPANKVDVETEDDINEDVFYPGNGNQV